MFHRFLPAFLTLLLALAFSTVTGCGGGDKDKKDKGASPAPAKDAKDKVASKGKIGFSALTLKNPFFKIIADSLSEEAKKAGFEVVVLDADRKVDVQASHIDDFITQKFTAIVLNPVDRIAIGPAIKKANDAGIPVFTNDLECAAEGVKIAGHIGTDNFQGGRLAGQAMVEALGEAGGKVLVVHFKQANSCVMRVAGFREVIESHNKDKQTGKVEIVGEVDGGGLQDEGYKAVSASLPANQNLRGIFAINDPSALGAWRALKEAGKETAVTLIGFDGQIEGKQAIKEGKIYADPIQFPAKMGIVTVQNIVKYLNGDKYEKNELIPTQLYKKADAEKDPELK